MVKSFKNSKTDGEPTADIASAPDDLIVALVNYECRARNLRMEIFETDVITESSWPLLQELFVANLSGFKVRTTKLCAVSGLPQTTVLRYLDHLQKFGVISRQDDPADLRVTLVSLTDSGAYWMHQYYTRIIQSERRLAERNESVFALRPLG